MATEHDSNFIKVTKTCCDGKSEEYLTSTSVADATGVFALWPKSNGGTDGNCCYLTQETAKTVCQAVTLYKCDGKYYMGSGGTPTHPGMLDFSGPWGTDAGTLVTTPESNPSSGNVTELTFNSASADPRSSAADPCATTIDSETSGIDSLSSQYHRIFGDISSISTDFDDNGWEPVVDGSPILEQTITVCGQIATTRDDFDKIPGGPWNYISAPDNNCSGQNTECPTTSDDMSTTLTHPVTAGDTEIYVTRVDIFDPDDTLVMGESQYTVLRNSHQYARLTLTEEAQTDAPIGMSLHKTPSCEQDSSIWLHGVAFTITSGVWSLTFPEHWLPSCNECPTGITASGDLDIKCDGTGELKIKTEQNGEVFEFSPVKLNKDDTSHFMGQPIHGGMRGEIGTTQILA